MNMSFLLFCLISLWKGKWKWKNQLIVIYNHLIIEFTNQLIVQQLSKQNDLFPFQLHKYHYSLSLPSTFETSWRSKKKMKLKKGDIFRFLVSIIINLDNKHLLSWQMVQSWITFILMIMAIDFYWTLINFQWIRLMLMLI